MIYANYRNINNITGVRPLQICSKFDDLRKYINASKNILKECRTKINFSIKINYYTFF